MSQYKVTMNSISETYEAESSSEALNKFAQDAGYKDWDDACDGGLASDDEVDIEYL